MATTIHWYPGHMKKAREQIAGMVRKTDAVIEILDARLPASSANPLLAELRGNRPCIRVLNKSDLADPLTTAAWVRYLETDDRVRALPLDAKERSAANHLVRLCGELVPGRGQLGSPLRLLVFGIPNVGKSTLINTLAGRPLARIGDKPAITTCPQRIDLRNGIVLYDTPGLLWPALTDQLGAQRLAASGAIGVSALDCASVGLFAAGFMLQRYPELLRGRLGFDELPVDAAQLLDAIGRRRGCLVSGGEVDLYRAADIFLRELRSGKLGRVSFEEPPAQGPTPAPQTGSPSS